MEFLSSMPCYDSSNFTKLVKFAPENSVTTKKLSPYISTNNHEPEQVIQKDKSNILLRYLYKKYYTDSVNVNKRKTLKSVNEESIDEEPKAKSSKSTDSLSSQNSYCTSCSSQEI